MDRLFYPVGNVREGQLEQGGGIGTGRYLSIDYSPPGDSYVPAFSVSRRPPDDSETPVVHFAAGDRQLGNVLTLDRIEDGLFFGAYFEGDEKTTLDENGDFETDGYVYTQSYFQFLEQAADPPALLIDAAQLWVSDGTGLGDAGDFFFRIHQGGDPGSDSRIGFDISTFTTAGFVKNDVNGLLTGGNAAAGAGVFREIATGNVFGPAAAGRDALTGDYNFAAIAGALDAVTSGWANITIGRDAGGQITDGDYNHAFGYECLNYENYGYDFVVANGWRAGYNCDAGDYDVIIGGGAMASASGYTVSNGSNVFIGPLTARYINGAYYCVGICSEALETLTTAMGVTAVGREAGTLQTSGDYNSWYGYSAGSDNQTGEENSGFGELSVCNMQNGNGNTGAGVLAIAGNNSSKVTGDYNSGFGFGAGNKIQATSAGNLFLGKYSGPSSYTTMSDKLYISNAYDTPIIGGDFSTSRVGIMVDPNGAGLTNILTVQQTSATDPLADSWATYPSDRTHKVILGVAGSLLENFRQVNIYRYKRKVIVSDEEVLYEAFRSKQYQDKYKSEYKKAKEQMKALMKPDKTQRKYLSSPKPAPTKPIKTAKIFSDIMAEMEKRIRPGSIINLAEMKEKIRQRKEKQAKFQAERVGIMVDDPEVPDEILIGLDNSDSQGIDLLAYIGWLHAVMKEQDGIIQDLQQRVANLEAA